MQTVIIITITIIVINIITTTIIICTCFLNKRGQKNKRALRRLRRLKLNFCLATITVYSHVHSHKTFTRDHNSV